MKSQDIGSQLQAKRVEMAEFMKGYESFTAEQIAEARTRNEELTKLSKDYDDAIEVEQMAKTNEVAIFNYKTPATTPNFPANGRGKEPEVKSLETLVRESGEYKLLRAGQLKEALIHVPNVYDFKTLLTLSDYNVEPTRLPQIVPEALEERTVADLMLQGRTSGNTITYMEETTFTNSAAEVAEGGLKPESAIDFTEVTESVRKIATWLPATMELLDDVPMMESYIRGRLAFMVERREEQQLLTGDGTAPNISGILDRANIQTQAKGADPTPDAVYKAMTKIRVNAFAEPTAAVFHPNDWQDIRLLRTADGLYIWGSPTEAGPERIWGLEVRITTAMTENTALVGAFRPYAQIFRRQGIVIRISTEHDTYFIYNKIAILAESRLALAVYRPAAFCTVTGI